MGGSDEAAVVYLYAPDRRGRHMREHLVGFHGVLQVDGYSGYDKLTNSLCPPVPEARSRLAAWPFCP
jgi:hypothetical protein